jgi:hypothetical protein
MRKREKTMICQKCKKIKAVVNHNGGKYCTWYCAKKPAVGCESKDFFNGFKLSKSIHESDGMLKEQHDFDEAMNGMGIYAETYK